MLKHRIIPIILIDGFSVLKTINFGTRRNIGSPITVMNTFETRNVDEMVILDIDASKQKRAFDFWLVKEISQECFMPLTLGGGIKNCTDIENLLNAGADKVSINSAAISDPSFIAEAVRTFGSQCIVISLDIAPNLKLHTTNDLDNPPFTVTDFIKKMEDLDVGEFLITDINQEGRLEGPNLELAHSLANQTSKPVIYNGGVRAPSDCVDLIRDANVNAVGCSSIFYFTNYTPRDCSIELINQGIPARTT